MAGGESPISDDTEKSVAKDRAEPDEKRGIEEGGKEHLATWKSKKKVAAARTEKEERGEDKMAPLHTKSLLTFGVSFLHTDFVPQLVKNMPRLEHISVIIRVRQSFTLSCIKM